jgi:gliding motility-associated-like protein
MRKVLFILTMALAFILPNEVSASHAAGGEIYYKHITGNQYKIFVFLYRDAYGITMPTSVSVCISSSCGSVNNAVLPQVPHPITGAASGSPVANLNECASPTSSTGGGINYELYTYSANVTLTGPCADWRFSYSLNARNSAIDNLVNAGSQNIYLEAKLNNTIGPNTSPEFRTPAIKRWCVLDPNDPGVKPVVWSQAAAEPDGDSLLYKFANPQGGGNCGPGTTLNYAGGYSLANPMTTSAGVSVDRSNGTFTFTPIQEEVVVIRVDVEEYRFNTTRLRWEFVGSSMRDMQVAISSQCVNSVAAADSLSLPTGVGVNTSIPIDSVRGLVGNTIPVSNNIDFQNSTPTDTLVRVQMLTNYACNDAVVSLPFEKPILCSSIDPTDFRILGPDGVARPVHYVTDNCDIELTTTLIDLHLYQSFDVNGVYVLYLKRGNDGNTLTNRCGFEVKDNVVYLINVTNCPQLDYEVENVTTVEDKHIKIEYRLNGASYYSNTFNQISVLRANNDQNFQKIAEIKDQTVREYIDTSVDAYAVDNQIYQYLLQMYTNGNPRNPTNFVNSIVLGSDSVGDNDIEFSWNAYLNDTYAGNVDYEFFEGVYDSTQMDWNWTSIQKVGTSLSYVYTVPSNRPGQFWYKVEASDAGGGNTKISSSNYLKLGVPAPIVEPGETPVVNYVPNVITPNGDSKNDRFYFQFLPTTPGTRPYSNVSLSIFNRWGKSVFQDDNFMQRNNEEEGWDGTDQNSKKRVADGVYFYTARFTDEATGKVEELKGSITVSGGGGV